MKPIDVWMRASLRSPPPAAMLRATCSTLCSFAALPRKVRTAASSFRCTPTSRSVSACSLGIATSDASTEPMKDSAAGSAPPGAIVAPLLPEPSRIADDMLVLLPVLALHSRHAARRARRGSLDRRARARLRVTAAGAAAGVGVYVYGEIG